MSRTIIIEIQVPDEGAEDLRRQIEREIAQKHPWIPGALLASAENIIVMMSLPADYAESAE